jgi:hypothetical protein
MITPQNWRSDPSKVWSATARDLGNQLEALVTRKLDDLAALEALTTKAGFSCDSTGQWWYTKSDPSTLIPTPQALQAKPLGSRMQTIS